MDLTSEHAAAAVERYPCSKCEAPVASSCWTQAGKTAAKYYTAWFTLVPSLRYELTVAVPGDQCPGKK
ncbi:hypothetical protein [Rhodococcus sp. H29-C3]|uniref:zinc finger domain-containing protein n=1 Tax=Rhodococcus sp. H29-C3 TaxID=3046307 RepID=UPI0024BB5A92|nr:hypothetical protein [Rhodococcus sp. H29-C3]MDJ0362246.1 hypothetical protein [Rhodococcus sp. H29-C3]